MVSPLAYSGANATIGEWKGLRPSLTFATLYVFLKSLIMTLKNRAKIHTNECKFPFVLQYEMLILLKYNIMFQHICEMP